MRARRTLLTGAALVLAALAVPGAASAHGLVQRASLPIPEWLFAWAAVIVLVVSFVALAAMWPKPRLEDVEWRALPGPLGRAAGSRLVEIVCGAIGVMLLALVIWAGFAGRQGAQDNLAPTFILIIFWVGLAFPSVLFGDVFRLFNPWRALGRLTGWALRGKVSGRRAYPERLGRWPAAVGLLAFTWVELASTWSEQPQTLVTAALVYVVAMLVAQAIYGVDVWERRGDAFAVYFNLFSRLSVWETRGHVLGTRPFLGGLPSLDRLPGTTAVVAVMIGTVTYDGLSQGSIWQDLSVSLNDLWSSLGVGFDTVPVLTATVGLVVSVALIALFYWLGIRGAQSVGGGFSEEQLRRGFLHSLIPIAFVYVVAHYLTFLLFEGQAIGYLASDPLGRGWDLLGTATSGIDYSLISQNTTWYLQVGFVVAGHVAGLVLAHDRALALYPKVRLAVRSQYWMLAVMVGFTSLALWLLAQAGA